MPPRGAITGLVQSDVVELSLDEVSVDVVSVEVVSVADATGAGRVTFAPPHSALRDADAFGDRRNRRDTSEIATAVAQASHHALRTRAPRTSRGLTGAPDGPVHPDADAGAAGARGGCNAGVVSSPREWGRPGPARPRVCVCPPPPPAGAPAGA